MGKNPHPRSGRPSRPYRGGHSGRGGSHEKGGRAVLALGSLVGLLGAAAGAAELLRSVL